MDLTDWFMVVMRWLHVLAATAWIGGSIFFFAVLRPALRASSDGSLLNRLAGQEFRQLVDVAIWVLLVSGRHHIRGQTDFFALYAHLRGGSGSENCIFHLDVRPGLVSQARLLNHAA